MIVKRITGPKDIKVTMDISDFADKYGLVLVITKDNPYDESKPVSAEFEDCEVKTDWQGNTGMRSGYGKTEKEAVLAYINNISGETLIFGKRKEPKQEIYVPILTFKGCLK